MKLAVYELPRSANIELLPDLTNLLSKFFSSSFALDVRSANKRYLAVLWHCDIFLTFP